MSRQSFTVVIQRSPAEVFTYMDDVSREHEWQPNLRSAEQNPPGPSKVGTRKRYVSDFMGRTVENTYMVTAIEPGRRIAYQTDKDSTIDAKTEVVYEPHGAGTSVTMSVEAKPKGVLRFLPAAMLEAASRDEMEAAMARLKERLEMA
jgi:uncharacterized membrane protein